jgi:hypothetical protein
VEIQCLEKSEKVLVLGKNFEFSHSQE